MHIPNGEGHIFIFLLFSRFSKYLPLRIHFLSVCFRSFSFSALVCKGLLNLSSEIFCSCCKAVYYMYTGCPNSQVYIYPVACVKCDFPTRLRSEVSVLGRFRPVWAVDRFLLFLLPEGVIELDRIFP